jgi:TolA-binding protein
MFTAAELGRVMCLEARGDVDKALLEFNSFLLTHPDNYLTPQALFGKARCLQITGKLTDAKIVYEDFIAAYPESKWRQQAESALHMIDRQLRAKQQGN